MNSEFGVNQTQVLNELEKSEPPSISFSPCQPQNKTSNNSNKNDSKIEICTDVNGRHQKENTLKVVGAPFIVKTCDQVLYIKGAKAISNYDDCSSRQEGFFTMSMFMVNYFASDKPNTLKRSILIEHMSQLPTYIQGTGKKCLNFEDGKTPGRFGICFEDKAITETLYSAFMNFMKCRMGDNLRPLSIPQLKRVYELTCGGQPIDPRLIFSNNKDDLISGISKNIKGGLNPYYPLQFPPGGKPQVEYINGKKN